MPRFPVAFGKRKSTADAFENVSVAPEQPSSFRVLDRAEVAGGKSFDGGVRLAVKPQLMPRAPMSDVASIEEDNIFADLKTNRGSGSGSSTTIKTASTDNSSRHSNASTAPSSADLGGPEEWRAQNKRSHGDIPVPPIPKSSSSGFLKAAGRSWSFGGQKKHLPPIPVAEEPLPESPPPPPPPPPIYDEYGGGRARAQTTSTTSTATPPKLEEDFQLDLGGDFSKMLMGFDKRGSVATVRDDPNGRQALAPRSLTAGRMNQPSPIQIDRTTKVESSPYSWSSQNSGDQLLTMSPLHRSPMDENHPPQIPRHGSPLAGRPQVPESGSRKSSGLFGRQKAMADQVEAEDEDSRLLKESLSTVGKFMSGAAPTNSTGRYRRNEDTFGSYRQVSSDSTPSRAAAGKDDDDNIFDSSLARSSRLAHRYVSRKPSPPRNKVMTPAQFERYRKDKERQDTQEEVAKQPADSKVEDDDEDNYEDDDDEVEKAKQAAKQRRKQEAHMTVYRQQMTKVTGESNGAAPSRPSLQMSFSTPNLANMTGPASAGPSPPGGGSDGSDDEEVPLAILAAHGFPNKNRPPTRLSTMISNPNLRAATQPSYQRPGSVVGEAAPSGSGGRLPVFARNLPQDPYVGAGLVHSATRESLAFGGGSPVAGLPGSGGGLPPGGLVGVIANEERSRAMRRGSPAIDGHKNMPLPNMNGPAPAVDPMGALPHQMMYPGMGPPTPMLTPGDQAQIQMTQQMQQFMQMQMQFMQMMAANGGAASPGLGQRPMSQMGLMGMPHGMDPMGMMGMPGMGMGAMGMATPDAMRHSFVDNSSVNYSLPRPEHTRSMSMVQPSSASWIQAQAPRGGGGGYAPSIRVQGANGYAPSIAPSERSNVGLPGRYRPVSQALPPMPSLPPIGQLQKSSTMSGALGGAGWDQTRKQVNRSPLQKSGAASDDEDEEQGWEAMKAKRDRKKSMWRSKKSNGSDLSAFIS